MALLAERGYEALDVVEALDRLYAGTLAPNAIALTFDDGYVDNAVHAMPVLERHGFRGTVFVVMDLVSGKAGFAKGHGSPAPLLGWEEIQQLDGRSPLTFEAHTVTHPALSSHPTRRAGRRSRSAGVRSGKPSAGRRSHSATRAASSGHASTSPSAVPASATRSPPSPASTRRRPTRSSSGARR